MVVGRTASRSASARTHTWPREFDITDAVRPGEERPAAGRRQVVRRDVHRGPGPVVARRDHPAGVPLRHAAGASGRRAGRRRRRGPAADRRRCRRRGSADRRGSARLVGLDRARRRRAGRPAVGERPGLAAPARRRVAGRGRPGSPTTRRPRRVDPPGGRGRPGRGRRGRPGTARSPPRSAATAARSAWAGLRIEARVEGVEPWTAQTPALYPLTVSLHDPDGAVVETASYRVGFRSVEIAGVDLLVNGARPYIRGINRHDSDPWTGRTLTAEQIRADLVTHQAVRLQRRPHLALPERPGAARPRRRARPVRHRRGRHRVPRLRPPPRRPTRAT